MLRGHTKKENATRERNTTALVKESLGKDFSSKLKSNRRNEYRDYRKENGQGDASFRRYLSKKQALEKAKE